MSAMLIKNSFERLDYLVIRGKTFVKNPEHTLIKYSSKLKNIPLISNQNTLIFLKVENLDI